MSDASAGDPIRALLDAGILPSTRFGPTSRYAGVELGALDVPGEDAPVPYLKRRFVPGPDRFADQSEATVIDGDRRDTLAAVHLGTPDLWWRLADANGAIDPRELTETPGDTVRITPAAGIPGASDE